MRPIIDELHHTSFPDWLSGGFAAPEFPELYVRLLEKFSARYDWVQDYTIFNEPLSTTLFCSYTGMWYPHSRSTRAFVQMAQNVGRAICLGSAMLTRRDPAVQLIHVDTAEYHRSLDSKSENWVRFANDRRFMMHDLILGRITRDHPLWLHLHKNGMTSEEREHFIDNPARIDVLGLDYDQHSEMDWFWNTRDRAAGISRTVQRPRGFRSVAKDYSERFKLPMMLSETNIRGEISDRITWLKFMTEYRPVRVVREAGAGQGRIAGSTGL